MSANAYAALSRARAYRFHQPPEIGEHSVLVRPVLSIGLPALLVGVSYYVGTRIGFVLTPSSSPTATFWPPNAILLAALLLAPTRMWWAFLLAVLPAHLLAQTQVGVQTWTAFGWFISNTSEALIGAWCITRFAKGRSVVDSVRGVVLFFVFGVLLAPLVTSFLDAAVVVITGLGKGYWTHGTTRFFTNTLSELTLVPAIVLWSSRGMPWIRKASFARCLEASLLVAGSVIVSSLVFGTQTASSDTIPALVYAPLPFLLWAVVRFGSGGLSSCFLLMTLISIGNAMRGRGPFSSASMADNVLSLQVMLCMVAVPLLLLAALMVERRIAEEMVRDTTGRLIEAQEQERRRIASELHDDLGQQLALAQVEIDRLSGKCDASLKPRFTGLFNQLSEISTTTHEISHGLHPSQLERLGLAIAVKRLCSDLGREKSLSIQLTVGDVPERLEPTISLCLYRVTQEALHNILTHSRANKAEIGLKRAGGRILLKIIDDGIGFDLGREATAGLGLISMRERVRSVGGSIDVVSSPNKGTRIEVMVPLRDLASTEVSDVA